MRFSVPLHCELRVIYSHAFRLEMQVMERFERENGGELMVATLCLLEVSSWMAKNIRIILFLASGQHISVFWIFSL